MKNVLVIGKFNTENLGLQVAETLNEIGYNALRFAFGHNSPSSGSRIKHRFNQVKRVVHDFTDNLPTIRAKRMNILWGLARKHKIDYVIVCHDFLQPEEVEHLKKLTQAKIAMWFPDALVNFGKGYFMNAAYDGLFFKDPYIVKALLNVPLGPVYYMPECFNPKRHKLTNPVINDKYICDITTAGNAHSWRVAFYRHLSS